MGNIPLCSCTQVNNYSKVEVTVVASKPFEQEITIPMMYKKLNIPNSLPYELQFIRLSKTIRRKNDEIEISPRCLPCKLFDNPKTPPMSNSHYAIDQSLFTNRTLSKEEMVSLTQIILNHFLFSDMPNNIVELIMSELEMYCIEKGKTVYLEGYEGYFLYIILKGEVVSFVKGSEKKTLKKWETFGGISILTDTKHEETIKTQRECDLLALRKAAYHSIKNKFTDDNNKEKMAFINSIPFLKQLGIINKFNLIQRLTVLQYDINQVIIHKGEMSDRIYFIQEGKASLRVDDKGLLMHKGSYFGESAILYNTEQSFDVVAMEAVKCSVLSRRDLQQSLGNDYKDILFYSLFLSLIAQNSFLADIYINSVKQNLFKCFKLCYYAKGDMVYTKSRNDKRIIFLLEGRLCKDRTSREIGGKGQMIGEDLFLGRIDRYEYNIRAMSSCISFEASIESVYNNLGIRVLNGKKVNIYKRISKLRKIYLFKHLSDRTLESFALNMKKEKYIKGQVIISEGSFGELFYLICKGKVVVTKNRKMIRNLESGNCFGEIALFTNVSRTASVIACEDVICYLISKQDFDQILSDGAIKEYLMKKIALNDSNISLSDLFFNKFLGKGKFGNVYLVHNKKNAYAIKSVSRKKVQKENVLIKYLQNERRIMLSLEHPFIVKLVKTLKNKLNCYFVIEFVNGINLDDYLTLEKKIKNIDELKFYIGILVLIIEYLQNKSLVHRDIKPSNIMINSNGYLKIIDFGTAKILSDYTMTVVGTPHYISPEILVGKGYSLSCDFWSLGICVYEMFYGIYPFGNEAEEIIEIYKEIVNNDFLFPSEKPKNKDVNELIHGLLTKNVGKRYCQSSVIKELKLFEGFDWDKLIDMKLAAPFIPSAFDENSLLLGVTPFEKAMELYENPELEDTTYEDNLKNSIGQFNTNWADEF